MGAFEMAATMMAENPYKSPENSPIGMREANSSVGSGEYVPSLLLEVGCWILCGILGFLTLVTAQNPTAGWEQIAFVSGLLLLFITCVVITVRIRAARAEARCRDFVRTKTQGPDASKHLRPF